MSRVWTTTTSDDAKPLTYADLEAFVKMLDSLPPPPPPPDPTQCMECKRRMILREAHPIFVGQFSLIPACYICGTCYAAWKHACAT